MEGRADEEEEMTAWRESSEKGEKRYKVSKERFWEGAKGMIKRVERN
jgi:hypothetical protein